MNSLRFRLTAVLLVIEIALLLSMAYLVFHRSSRAMVDALDAEISAHLRQFASEIEEGEPPERLVAELSASQRAEFDKDHSSFYQVRAGDGDIIAKSPSLGGESRSLPDDWDDDLDVGETMFEFDTWDDEEIRVGTLVVSETLPLKTEIRERNRESVTVVQVGISTRDFRDRQRDLIDYLSMIGGSLLLISLLAALTLVSWSLRPVRRLSDAVRRITERSLDSRLPETGLPKELRPLSEGFNETLARLEKAFARERRFLADASHELRTPVSVSLSAMEVALKQTRTPEEYVQTLEKSLRATIRLRSLVERMMAVARDDQRHAAMNAEAVDLTSVVNEVVEFLRPLAEQREVTMRWERPGREPVLRGDRFQIQELVENLLANGIVHNRAGGWVEVTVEVNDPGGGCSLHVRDDGPGIPLEHFPHIFERFHRVDPSRSRGHGGSGLGLAIAKSIVEAHGGSIDVQARPGSGVEFIVRFPG